MTTELVTNFLSDPVRVIEGIITLLSIAYGYACAGTLKEVIHATKTFAKIGAKGLAIKADGKVTVQETDEFGQLCWDFWEDMEKIVSRGIANHRDVPFLLPAIERVVSKVDQYVNIDALLQSPEVLKYVSQSPELQDAVTKIILSTLKPVAEPVADMNTTVTGLNCDVPSATSTNVQTPDIQTTPTKSNEA